MVPVRYLLLTLSFRQWNAFVNTKNNNDNKNHDDDNDNRNKNKLIYKIL